jgi:hypothetical protein
MSSKSSYSTILRYTRVLAALGSVVAGIRHSCSGYAGFWPWLLAAGPRRQENAKMRIDQKLLQLPFRRGPKQLRKLGRKPEE